MKEPKLITILKSLNSNELRNLWKFLDSDYFVSDKQPLNYFIKLKKGIGNGERLIEHEELFQKAFPEEPFHYGKFARLNSRLLQLIYQFMAVEHLNSDELRRWGIVMDALEHRGESAPITITVSSLERALKRAPDSSEKLWQTYRMLEIQSTQSSHRGRQNQKVSDKSVLEALNQFYELARLRLECVMLNRKRVLGEPNSSSISPNSELIKLYNLIKASLQSPENLPQYEEMEKALRKLLDGINGGQPSPELRDACLFILNQCIRLINLKEQGLAHQQLNNLYDKLLEKKALLINQKLSPWHFKNYTQNLVLSGEYKEAQKIIDNYGHRLAGLQPQDSVLFARAYIDFHQNKFQETQTALQTLVQDCKDIYLALDGRVLLLECYFELNDFDAFEYGCESFRIYLMRKQSGMPEVYFQLYSHFARHLRQLGNLMFGLPKNQSQKLEVLVKRLQTKESVLHREWLLKKCQVHLASN